MSNIVSRGTGSQFRDALAGPVLALAVFCCLAPAAAGVAARAETKARPCPDGHGEPVKAVSVDPHLDVELADGRRLKLLGLTPPRGTRDWPELAEMARGALAGWIVGAPALAAIQAGPKDRWGRNRARLFVSPGASPAGGRSVVAGLVEAGWGIVAPQSAVAGCLPDLLALEDKARRQRLGLWSDAWHRPVAALDVANLKARTGTFAIVEGAVLDVRPWRSVVFINFARRRTEGISLMLTRRGLVAFRKASVDPAGYKGRRVRVRGVPVLRKGLRMTIAGPEFIEILD